MRVNRPMNAASFLLAFAGLGGWAAGGSAQTPAITANGREIFSLNAAGAATGGIPAGLRLLSGSVTVATRDGARMLKASTPTEFLIALPEALPQDFTLEFDIVPKQCCNPEDLAVEGTPTLSRSSGSAQILWHRNVQSVMGGGPAYQSTTPADLQESTPGQLTNIVISVEGETVKLYTNGKRLYTLTERRFARGRVLRVFLGGQDDGDQAVHLARLRVSAGAATATTIAQQSSTVQVPVSTSPVNVQPAGGTPASIAPTPAPPPATSVTPRASTGAVEAGPVTTATPRTTLGTLPSRSVELAGFTAIGTFSSFASRTITLTGFSAMGGFTSVAPRTVTLSGFSATGGFTNVAPRTVTLDGFTATGVFTSAPRTVTLAGFTAAGVFASSPRTVTLAGFSATGVYTSFAPRTVVLSGFTSVGVFTTLAPRTVTLSGFSAVGINP